MCLSDTSKMMYFYTKSPFECGASVKCCWQSSAIFGSSVSSLKISCVTILSPPCSHRFQPPVNAVHHIDSVNNGRHQSINLKPPQRRWALTGSDVDSDEEICRMVAAQDASHAALRQEVEEDNLEVVGLDYLAKFDRSSQQRNGMEHILTITVFHLFLE